MLNRRETIKRTIGAIAGLAGVKAIEPKAAIAETPLIPVLSESAREAARNDVTVAIRNWFVNRNPLLTRTNWVPVDRVDFLMHSHRFANKAELAEIGVPRGLFTVGYSRQQYCQVFQFPVAVGSTFPGIPPQSLPGGMQTPFDFNRTIQLQNMADDLEMSLYWGKAQAPSLGDDMSDAKMSGLFCILETNNAKVPKNADRYRFDDFKRDTLVASRSSGGEPDLLLVATNFHTAFATWGVPIERRSMGETVFGTPIILFGSPALPGVAIVEAPLLQSGSAVALTSSEVFIRNKQNPHWRLRPNRKDPIEGEWIFEGAIEVINESHHAAVSGIERYAA